MIRHRALQAAGAPSLVDGDGRTVRVRLVSWGVPSSVTDDGGRTWYRESFARGGLQAPPDVHDVVMAARDGHHREPVGRIVATEDLDDGLYADVRMVATARADELLALIDEQLLSVSAEFDDDPTPARAGEHVQRTTAVLTGLAFTHLPQHTTAAVIGRRSHEETTMEDTIDDPTAVDPTTDDPTPAPAAPVEHTRSLEPTPATAPARRPSPTLPHRTAELVTEVQTRFRSFGEFVRAAALGEVTRQERDRYYRALSSATTTDTSGLIQTQWIRDVIDLIRPAMPTVQAFEQRPLPDQGLTISQPTVTTRPTIAKQAAQGDAISSQKAVIGSTSWTVDTFAGGQGMSFQSILRTDPAYLAEVMRLHTVEMALEIEEAVVAGVLAAADDVHTAVELSNTATEYQDAFIDAAALILGSAGIQRLPTLAVLNVPMWVLLGKAKDSAGRPLFPGLSPLNPQGSFQLTDGTGEVRSLRYFVSPKMATTNAKAVVGVPEAYRTMMGPIQTIQNDVPETLTQEHAVFQFVAHGKVDARGLALIQNAS